MTPAPGTPAADMEAATAMAQRIVAGDHQGGWTELCVLSRGIIAYQDALAAERTERKAARQLANIAKACLDDAERDCKAETAEKERLAGRLEIAERNVADNADLAGRWIAEHDRQQERASTLADALQSTLSWLTSYPGGGALPCYDRARAALAALPPSSAPCFAKASQGETEDRQASGWGPITDDDGVVTRAAVELIAGRCAAIARERAGGQAWKRGAALRVAQAIEAECALPPASGQEKTDEHR